ncbi:MAG: hypothetical protein M1820_000873 [Bogoriella megaspora]|nr:MAG: hypothetical protein M1820_000873 [Bogoriella megaspora]
MAERPRVTTPLRRPDAEDYVPFVPRIRDNDSFVELVRKLSGYILEAIKVPHSFEELRKVAHGRSLTPLIESLTRDVHHPDVVAALLVLKGYFSSFENVDDAAINETRGFACEIVAWRFVAHLSERECIDFLLHDISKTSGEYHDEEANRVSTDYSFYRDGEEIEESATPSESYASTEDQDYLSSFENLNALEIAVVSGAKKFLSQKTVQKILNGIWNGDIVFWENMSSNSRKTARFYNRR